MKQRNTDWSWKLNLTKTGSGEEREYKNIFKKAQGINYVKYHVMTSYLIFISQIPFKCWYFSIYFFYFLNYFFFCISNKCTFMSLHHRNWMYMYLFLPQLWEFTLYNKFLSLLWHVKNCLFCADAVVITYVGPHLWGFLTWSSQTNK